MQRRIYIPEELAQGYTRREFIKLLELAGVGVTIGAAGIMGGCKSKGPLAGAEAVITRCGLCGADCGMKAYVKKGRILAVEPWKEDPHSKGFMCDMGLANVEYLYSPDRITNPKRKRDGKWVDISWDDALGIIATKLTDLKQSLGPQSVVYHFGVSLVRAPFYRQLFKRFANVYGTPNFTGCGSQCAMARGIAAKLSVGSSSVDYEHAKVIVQWGANPSHSAFLDWLHKILPAKEKGAKLIVIDPRSNPMTEVADIHLQPKPGTDGALALAIANIIISRKLHDKKSVEKDGIGFREFANIAASYNAERAERITGIPAKDIERTAELYVGNHPATIDVGNAVELHVNGVQTVRSILLLQALTGNLKPRGDANKVSLADMEYKKHKPFAAKGYSAEKYPIFWEDRGMVTANVLPDVLLSGRPYPIKALIVSGGNPISTGPNANRQKEAYKKLDLIVVYDLFMTETAQSANLFLPAAAFLERDNIKVRDKIVFTPKVVDPQGSAWPEWKLWFELAKRMGYQAEFPWATLDDCVDEYLAPINLKTADLRKNFNGIPYNQTDRKGSEKEKKEERKYGTNSGKIEFNSPTIAKIGINPLPAYVEPFEDPGFKSLRARYPLIMTGAKTPYYFQSQFHNLPSLNAKFPSPAVELSREDATALGIVQDAFVVISTPQGKITAKAKIVKGLNKGAVAMAHGWASANVNELTDDSYLDPISAYPSLKGFYCRVEKA